MAAKPKSKSLFDSTRDEAIFRLEDAIADIRRMRESDFLSSDVWGPFQQRYSCVMDTLHTARDVLDRISPYERHRKTSEDATVPAIATKKPLAIEHKPDLPNLFQ